MRLKSINNVFLGAVLAVGMSSCGSISGLITKQKRPVFLMMAPSDLTVDVDGERQEITSEVFATQTIGNTTYTYYTSAVKLPYKKAVSMTIRSGGKSATFELQPKTFGAVWVGNIFSFPVVGHIVDMATKNSKVLKPRYIDVERALDGKPIKEWRGKGKLKRMQKRAIR